MKQGWQLKKLGEVCKTSSGGTPLKDKIEYYNSGNIPFLRSGEVCEKYIYKTEMFITELGLTNSSAKLFPVDTVLIAMYGATAGQVGILKIESTTNQAVCGVLPCKEVLSEFIYYFFLFYKDELVKQAVGGAQPNISQFKIKDTVIPLPPLPEQHRIVGKLDRAFEKIEKLRLTAEKNCKAARDLLEASLRFELSAKEGWENKQIIDVCLLKSGNSNANSSIEGSLPYVKVSDMNIVGNEKFIFHSTQYIDYESNKKSIFPIGTVIFPKRGGAILTNKKRLSKVEMCCDLNIMGVIPDHTLDSEYLYYYFLNVNLAKLFDGASIPQINNKDIAPLIIPLPPLPEQQRIVEKLDMISDRCRKMEGNYKQTISLCDDLKQSLLRKAFNGEL